MKADPAFKRWLEDNVDADLSTKAKFYEDEALVTLVREMRSRGKGSTSASRRAAAEAVLAHGSGTPHRGIAPAVAGGGLTVNIIKLSTGEVDRREIDVTPKTPMEEAREAVAEVEAELAGDA